MAPVGTTIWLPVVVGMLPVTCRSCGSAETNGPANPTLLGSRLSRMRTGVTGTNVDSLGPIADARQAVNDQTSAIAIARPAANHMTERIRNVSIAATPRIC